MKRFLSVIIGIAVIFMTGCGANGGSDATGASISQNTTLAGQITIPTVTATGIVTDISYQNDATLLAKFISGAAVTVNGKSYPFTLASSTRYFSITDVDPASTYDLKFTYKNLILRSIFAHQTGTIIKTVDLNSTSEAYLIEKYKFTAAQIKNFEIKSEYKEGLAKKFLTQLQNPGTTNESFTSAIQTELASFAINIPTIDALATNLTPAVDMTGTWVNTIGIKYYTLNLMGERAYEVIGFVTLKLKQSGSSVTGTLTLTPSKYTRLAEIGYPPVEEQKEIIGKIGSTNFTFTASQISGTFTTLSDNMRGTFKNTDLNNYFGFETEENGVSLNKTN